MSSHKLQSSQDYILAIKNTYVFLCSLPWKADGDKKEGSSDNEGGSKEC